MKLVELQRFSVRERQVMLELLVLERQIAGNVMLGIDQITRDAAPLFVNSNSMLRELEHGVDQTLCVRLLNYFHADAFSYSLMTPFMRSEVERDLLSQELPAPVAAVALAAAAGPGGRAGAQDASYSSILE